MMTAEKIEAQIRENFPDYEDRSIGYIIDDNFWGRDSYITTSLRYRISMEDRVGGEDQGSVYFVVIKVDDLYGEVRYFRIDGYYSSWDGTDWDSTEGLHEVAKIPVQTYEWAKVS